MSRQPAPLPDRLGSVFSRREALAQKLPAGRLRRSDLEAPFRGVRRIAERGTETEHTGRTGRGAEWRSAQIRAITAYSVNMHPAVCVTGRTAAVVWGLPVPPQPDDDIEIGRLASGCPPQARGVRGKRIREETARIVEHNGLRVTDPATTWTALGACLALPDLVAAGDALIRVPRIPGGFRPAECGPITTLQELQAAVEAGRRVGNPLLRAALPLLRTGASSAPESHLRLALGDAGLPEPELDFDVFDEHGRFLGCSEIAYPEFRTAFEYESEHHRVDREQWNRDIQKYRDYAEAGWEAVRVTERLLYRARHELGRQARAALRSRGWRH